MREPDLLTTRSFRWLAMRIIALLSTESRLQREKYPPKEQQPAR